MSEAPPRPAGRWTSTRRALVLGAAAWIVLGAPLPGLAQPRLRRIPRIGLLDPTVRDTDLYRAFLRGLRELGYLEGKSISIEGRFAEGRLERLPELARQLLDAKVEIMVVQSTPGVRAALEVKTTIPIVMVGVGDPVGSGFVTSLARPGGNLTGLSILSSDVSPKLIEMLRTMVPKVARIAVLVNLANPNSSVSLRNIRATAPLSGVKVLSLEVRTPSDIEREMTGLARQPHCAVVVPGDPLFRMQASQIAGLALRYKLPSAVGNREIVEAGGLLGYGADIAESYYRAATYVDRILKGAKPADLPVEQTTTLRMLINRKTARALGITIPNQLLLRADQVIE